jgi:hypothetical protein
LAREKKSGFIVALKVNMLQTHLVNFYLFVSLVPEKKTTVEKWCGASVETRN